MRKLIISIMSMIFILSSVAMAAEREYGIQGALHFDQNWIDQVNQQMSQQSGSYLQWVMVTLCDAYSSGPICSSQKTIYNQTYSKGQTTFPSQVIEIPPTVALSADSRYKVIFMYQIYWLG